eukprot:jgi/Mesvir1/29116/Mv25743-RA.1
MKNRKQEGGKGINKMGQKQDEEQETRLGERCRGRCKSGGGGHAGGVASWYNIFTHQPPCKKRKKRSLPGETVVENKESQRA